MTPYKNLDKMLSKLAPFIQLFINNYFNTKYKPMFQLKVVTDRQKP